MQTFSIGPNQAGQRLDKFLKKFMPDAGSGFLYKMLRKKNIVLNGRKADGTEILAINDTVSFFFSDETFEKFTGKTDNLEVFISDRFKVYQEAYMKLKGIQVVFENENILILNKPAGILSQKASHNDISLNEWMIGYLIKTIPHFMDELSTFKPSVCNRLDRNTSGLVVCGKTLRGTQYLSRLIHDREIKKFYHTICVGNVTKSAKISGYLIKDEVKNRVFVSSIPGNEKESYIQTSYTPLQYLKTNTTLLEVELITGKPHQIRAHLSSIGHPIVGDEKYGNHKENLFFKEHYGIHFQLLHACRLEFPTNREAEEFNVNGKIITIDDPTTFHTLIN